MPRVQLSWIVCAMFSLTAPSTTHQLLLRSSLKRKVPRPNQTPGSACTRGHPPVPQQMTFHPELTLAYTSRAQGWQWSRVCSMLRSRITRALSHDRALHCRSGHFPFRAPLHSGILLQATYVSWFAMYRLQTALFSALLHRWADALLIRCCQSPHLSHDACGHQHLASPDPLLTIGN